VDFGVTLCFTIDAKENVDSEIELSGERTSHDVMLLLLWKAHPCSLVSKPSYFHHNMMFSHWSIFLLYLSVKYVMF